MERSQHNLDPLTCAVLYKGRQFPSAQLRLRPPKAPGRCSADPHTTASCGRCRSHSSSGPSPPPHAPCAMAPGPPAGRLQGVRGRSGGCLEDHCSIPAACLAAARSAVRTHLESQVRLRGLVHVCEVGLARVPAVGWFEGSVQLCTACGVGQAIPSSSTCRTTQRCLPHSRRLQSLAQFTATKCTGPPTAQTLGS